MLIDEGEAIARLSQGEVVAIPTDTVYGVAVAVRAPGSTAALFALKERPADVALPVLITDVSDADAYATFTNEGALLAERFWPGALTVVGIRTDASRGWDLGGDGQTIGLRCPDDDRVRQITRMVGPLVTTSANKHGERPCTTAAQVMALFAALPVFDGGMCHGEPSTVVDATQTPLRVLRPGAIAIG